MPLPSPETVAVVGAAPSMRLPLHECFHSWQGEGCHAGRSAFFIRLFGCPVHCPWCDSAGTWHPEKIPSRIARVEVETLVETARAARPDFVVLTGGEPAIHDLGPLSAGLRAAGLAVHLETSGAFPLRGTFDWITLSPKRWKWPLAENLARAHEFKLILETPAAFGDYWPLVEGPAGKSRAVWLHPEWSRREDPALLAFITDEVKRRGAPLRAGWQLHKLYAADARDPRARA
jgi:7-carboxy-7-deazaguanine synthase